MKKQSTIRGAAYITIGRILSKIIGLFRERLFAVYFGTSYVLDVFRMGVSLMGLIGVVINPILSYGTPNISESYEKKDWLHIKHNMQVILLLAGGLGVLFSLIFILFPHAVIKTFLPYIYTDPQKLSVATSMMVLIGIMSIVYVFLTIFENLLIAIHIYTHLGIKDPLINTIWTTTVAIAPVPLSIIWGRIAGALLYGIFALWLLYKAVRYMRKYFGGDSGPSRKLLMRDMFVGTLPLYLGGSMALINQFIDRAMAGYLGEGNVSILGYGGVIAGIIGSLLVLPFVQSIYPKTSAYIRTGNTEGFLKEAHKITSIVLYFSIPSLVGLALLYYRTAYFFFGSDKMNASVLNIIGIVAIFMAYAQIIRVSSIYSSALIPLKRTDIGMKIALFITPLNILLNYIFAFQMHMGVIGLKVATATALTISAITSLYILHKILGTLQLYSLIPPTIKTLIASFAMGVFILPLDKLLPQTRVFTLLIIFIGVSVYFITSYIERHEVLESIIDRVSSWLG